MKNNPLDSETEFAKFKKDLIVYLRDIHEAVALKNAKKLHQRLNTLKSASDNLGAQNVSKSCQAALDEMHRSSGNWVQLGRFACQISKDAESFKNEHLDWLSDHSKLRDS